LVGQVVNFLSAQDTFPSQSIIIQQRKGDLKVKKSDNEYHFNLFKPTSEHGRKNRNIIFTMVLIWFVSVFGFQLLLVILQKPTPEKTFTTFESVWDNVQSGNANKADKQDFIKSLIAVYGKSTVKKDKKEILKNGITVIAYSMVSDSEKVILSGYVVTLNNARENLTSTTDEAYIQLQATLSDTKKAINEMLDTRIGIESTSVEASLLPYCLNDEDKMLTDVDKEALPKIMKLYLVHNQSFLTDTKFLGFPFHYFYTAELLLILFVLLCLIYSFRIEALDKKYLNAQN
jgi:putative solute:sodium symporter small subunit